MNGCRSLNFFCFICFSAKGVAHPAIKPHKPQFSPLNFGHTLLTIEMRPDAICAISGHWLTTGAGSRCGIFSSVKHSQLLLPYLPYHTRWQYPQLSSADLEEGLQHQQQLCLSYPSEHLPQNPGWVYPSIVHDIWWIKPVSETDVDVFKNKEVKRYFIFKTKPPWITASKQDHSIWSPWQS